MDVHFLFAFEVEVIPVHFDLKGALVDEFLVVENSKGAKLTAFAMAITALFMRSMMAALSLPSSLPDIVERSMSKK